MIIYGCRNTRRGGARQTAGLDFDDDFNVGANGFGVESVRHIFLRDCLPVVYEISDLSGLGAEVAVESITVAFNRFDHDIGTDPLEGLSAQEQSAKIEEMDRAFRASYPDGIFGRRRPRGGSPTG